MSFNKLNDKLCEVDFYLCEYAKNMHIYHIYAYIKGVIYLFKKTLTVLCDISFGVNICVHEWQGHSFITNSHFGRDITVISAIYNVSYTHGGVIRFVVVVVVVVINKDKDKDLFIGPQEFVVGYSKAPKQPQSSARPTCHPQAMTRTGREPAIIRIAAWELAALRNVPRETIVVVVVVVVVVDVIER